MEKIKFYLPDFYNKFALNELVINLLNEYPECFYDNIEIGAVYGCFPGSLWNGGRVCPGYARKEQVLAVLEEYNKRGIPCRFTFTNSLLEEKHLYASPGGSCRPWSDMPNCFGELPRWRAYTRRWWPTTM